MIVSSLQLGKDQGGILWAISVVGNSKQRPHM